MVWTALKPGMREDREARVYRMPTLERIGRHLAGLDPASLAGAAHYVRTAPGQIVTPYRAELEAMLAALGV